MAFPPTHGRTPNDPGRKGGEDQAHGPGGRIDLNHASEEDIMSAGVDRRTAEQVLKFRDEHGGFETWRDLDGIPIPGEDRDKLRAHAVL